MTRYLDLLKKLTASQLAEEIKRRRERLNELESTHCQDREAGRETSIERYAAIGEAQTRLRLAERAYARETA